VGLKIRDGVAYGGVDSVWRSHCNYAVKNISRREYAMKKIAIASALLLATFSSTHPTPAHAADGHENSCLVTNVGVDLGDVHVICASGSVNYAFLTGGTGTGSCPTVDVDTLKMMEGVALTARATGLVLTVWYTDSCQSAGSIIRAITSLELKGN
jgi:hypothetical protein